MRLSNEDAITAAGLASELSQYAGGVALRVVLQRVTHASVVVEAREVGQIGAGLLALVGAAKGDTEANAKACARKIANLRIFEDQEGLMNRDIGEVGGAILVVSQFTLLADTRKGRRPSFGKAAPSAEAEPLVNCFRLELEQLGIPTATGVFGAQMKVSLVNDGPVTVVVEF